ncbi:MAG: YqgE/AlgH family protein [Bacteroidales bacterium]|nr:YqgE/AlgH family protein [Bacteroidales bacterium]
MSCHSSASMNENLDFFKIQHNDLQPQRGRVLIAEPFLQDSYFKRSVVLITEHDNKGTVGFVLNNPIEFRIDEMLKGFPLINSIVSVGGPVHTDTIHYIHTLGHVIPECEEILDQVYWGGDIEAIKSGIKDGWIKDYQIRFFVGYSSWHPGQLEREISENSWLVTGIDTLDVMHGSDVQLWRSILKKEDVRYQMWTRYPEDPAWN